MGSFTPPRQIGDHAVFRLMLDAARRAAATIAPVTIVGETGSGKNAVARFIHALSSRAGGPFREVSCARLNSELAESQAFGHVRGAFTGAIAAFAGWFAACHGGTFGLDELHRAQQRGQDWLVELLDWRGFQAVGGLKVLSPDVRVVVLSSVLPADLVQRGLLDPHLYYRLGMFPIVVPPLRERIDDIDALLAHLVPLLSARFALEQKTWSAGAIKSLKEFNWPGNVRQLEGVIREAMVHSDGAVGRDFVRAIIEAQPKEVPAEAAKGETILETLERTGSLSQTARHHSVCEKTVVRKREAQARLTLEIGSNPPFGESATR